MLQEGQPTILEVKGLKKSFGKNEVLKGIDLEIKKGELVARRLLQNTNPLYPLSTTLLKYGTKCTRIESNPFSS